MNPIAARQALKVASSLWGQFNKYRKDKAAEAYSALEEAANTAKSNTNDLGADLDARFPEARKQAGAVTKAAHDRIERALAEFNNRSEEAGERLVSATSELSDRAEKATRAGRKNAKKSITKTRKNARKQAKQATKATQAKRKQLGKKKSKSRSLFSVAGIIALIAAVAGGVYYLLRRNDTPGEVPPRVEDFADNSQPDTSGSTLVYTSTSEDDKTTATAGGNKGAGDLAEDGPEERDEELLNSLDEQLAAHREQAHAEQAQSERDAAADDITEQSDADSTDTSRVTDDSEDEGKHRLEGDDK